ncbi:MAG: DUF4010 domain-containing protein [Parvularculaceae bacterium]
MDAFASSDSILALQALGVAALSGFVIGFEREWTQELEKRRHAFAGARTFTLAGLVGALAALLVDGGTLIAVALGAVGALAVIAHYIDARETKDRGGTTELALLATVLLGAAAGRGEPVVAASGAVAIAVILSVKNMIEDWARSLSRTEIHAALRFLAVSVLVLPFLPDQALGPYAVLNPRELWLLVVLISGLSFLGYWLVKIFGARRGIVATGAVGGLASSTATTLSVSRFASEGRVEPKAAAAAILLANVVMLARIAALLGAISINVLIAAAPALVAAAMAGATIAVILLRGKPGELSGEAPVVLGNPFELRPALIFAVLLAVILVVSAYAVEKFGSAGLLTVGVLSGLADVDAISLSASRQAAAGIVTPEIAATASLAAAGANMIVKGAMATWIAGHKTGVVVAGAFAAMIVAGAMALFLV